MKKTELFCQALLSLPNLSHSVKKLLICTVLSLSSETQAKSVVGITSSPLFAGRHYSSLTQVIEKLGLALFKASEEKAAELRTTIQLLMLNFIRASEEYSFSLDHTPIHKPASKCLEERGFVYTSNNPISSNAPIDVGYLFSYLTLNEGQYCLPVDNVRVPLEESKTAVSAKQLITVLSNPKLPFHEAERIFCSVDSGFCQVDFIHECLSACDNLCLIVRMPAGMKVYQSYEGEQKKQGRTKCYGNVCYLDEHDKRRFYHPQAKESFDKEIQSINAISPSETLTLERQAANGRDLRIEVTRWNNLLLAGTRECKMTDFPCDILLVKVYDKETNELVFGKPMYLAIFGKTRSTADTETIVNQYRQRWNIEVHNRFAKQQLLLDKFATPSLQHLEAWAWIVALAYWLLFVASNEVETIVRPWERYLPKTKAAKQGAPKSVALTRKAAKAFFLTLDFEYLKPKSVKNGKGRATGTKMPPRAVNRPKKKPKKTKQSSQKATKTA